MQIIETALAFALTMLVLSLIVSTLVEMIHRALAMREKGMQALLGQLFDRVLGDYAERARPGIQKKALEELRAQFQTRMTASRAPIASDSGTKSGTAVLGQLGRSRPLNNLSLGAFMERLGSDDVGDMIVTAVKAAEGKAAEVGDAIIKSAAGKAVSAVDTVLQDVAQKYDNFCNEASELFARRARLLSVTVAIVVAFAIHVDPIELLQTYMRDPAVRNAVVSRQAQFVEDFMKQASPPVVAVTPEARLLPAQFEQQLATIRVAQAQLTDIGVPIGWTAQRLQSADMLWLMWNCPNPTAAAWFGDCDDSASIWLQVPTDLGRILSLLLGGLLIGLGGPFWFDAVKGITNIRSAVRGGAAQEPPTDANARASGSGTVTQPRTPVDIFKVANDARKVLAAALAKGGASP